MTTQPNLLQTILEDLKTFGGWLETEAEHAGVAAWNLTKSLFASLTAQQVQVLIRLATETITNAKPGEPIEALVADIMARAAAEEATWLVSVPTTVIAAYAAL